MTYDLKPKTASAASPSEEYEQGFRDGLAQIQKWHDTNHPGKQKTIILVVLVHNGEFDAETGLTLVAEAMEDAPHDEWYAEALETQEKMYGEEPPPGADTLYEILNRSN
jgi:hypothetical protein